MIYPLVRELAADGVPVTDATVSLAHASWAARIGIGVGIGWLVGGFALMPVALVGALVCRLVPRATAFAPAASPPPQASSLRLG
jgi:hypothetical protein